MPFDGGNWSGNNSYIEQSNPGQEGETLGFPGPRSTPDHVCSHNSIPKATPNRLHTSGQTLLLFLPPPKKLSALSKIQGLKKTVMK